MNLKTIKNSGRTVVLAVSAGIFASAASSAKAENLTGLVFQGNQIFTIDSATPTTILTAVGVSGLAGGEVLGGIDYLGSVLYGVGSAGNLYTINANTGVASLVNHFGPLNGIYYGMDASAAGIRIVSDSDVNILLNPTTGAIISSTPTLTPSTVNFDAIASQGSTMYAVDSLANTLNILNVATGTSTLVGPMGYDVSGKNGFDISGSSGIAYFASGVSSSGPTANLYTVNLSTGFASLDGVIGGGFLVSGLTVTAVPEPSTYAMALIGGISMITLMRRRK